MGQRFFFFFAHERAGEVEMAAKRGAKGVAQQRRMHGEIQAKWKRDLGIFLEQIFTRRGREFCWE